MHVCYLINQLAPGGAPTLLLDIISTTNDPDVTFTVCFIEGDDALAEDFESAGAEVVDFGASFKFAPKAMVRIARFFQRREFDIVHAHLPYSQTLARLSRLITNGFAVVSTQHNVPDNYHPITRTLERLTRRVDDRTIAVSEGVERAFTGDSARYIPGQNRQWCTIYNGIDVDKFASRVQSANPDTVRRKWAIDSDLVYLNVSRYVSAKSQVDLVAAMDQVVEENQEAHLFLVGWGERESQIRKVVNEWGLENHVTVTGRVPTVEEYYALADVFVSSSTFEGMPIAHLEAMAAGLPIVATDIPGVREVVADGTSGFLVPPGDPEALGDAMRKLRSSNRREDFGREGHKRVSEEFSIDQTVDIHLELYRELMDSGK